MILINLLLFALNVDAREISSILCNAKLVYLGTKIRDKIFKTETFSGSQNVLYPLKPVHAVNNVLNVLKTTLTYLFFRSVLMTAIVTTLMRTLMLIS